MKQAAERIAMAQPKRVVYTAIFGNYDELSPAPPCHCGMEFICYTDNPDLASPGWRVIVAEATSNDDPALNNRYYKILAHRHLGLYAHSLYVDGHVTLRRCPCALFDRYLDEALIAVPYHKDRNCIYEEAQYCLLDRKVSPEAMRAQTDAYAAEGFPQRYGLTENGVLLRNHGNPHVAAAMEMWWQEYCNRTRRDQISLPFVLWKTGLQAVELKEGPRLSDRYFSLRPHTKYRMSLLKRLVWHITTSKHRRRTYKYLAKLFGLLSSVRTTR
jgi:prepilin-type processing-associated H-X9-DG protein